MGKNESDVSRLIGTVTCVAVVVSAVIAICWPRIGKADQVLVAGIEFEQQDGVWVQLDSAGEPWEIRPGRILVKYDGDTQGSTYTTLVSNGLTPVSSTALPGGYFVFSYDDVNEAAPTVLATVLAVGGVQDAFLDTKLKFYGSPDPYFVNQWNLTKTRVDRAWEITAGDSSLVIAIMDRGVEMMHEDLADCIWINDAEVNGTPGFDDDHNGCIDDFNGCDFASNLNDPSTDNDPSPDDVEGEEHGTAVAGIACAARNNGKGIAGVCGGSEGNRPRLLPIRVRWLSDVARAFRYILRTGVDVVNMSGGGFTDPGGVCAALIDSAYANGTVFFGAIGNNGNDMSGPLAIRRTPS